MDELECIADELLSRWEKLEAAMAGRGISNDETDGE
jgi:hypothetical protein